MKTITNLKDLTANKYNEYQYENAKKKFDLYKEIETLGFNVKIIEKEDPFEGLQILINDHINVNEDWKGFKNLYSITSFEYMDYDNKKCVLDKNDLKEPNNMKVLTKNKIQAWIDYIESTNKLFKKESERLQKEIDDFVNEFKKIKGAKHITQNYHGDPINSGQVENKYFSFTFNVLRSGYIEKNLRVQYGLERDIKTLKKLFSL